MSGCTNHNQPDLPNGALTNFKFWHVLTAASQLLPAVEISTSLCFTTKDCLCYCDTSPGVPEHTDNVPLYGTRPQMQIHRLTATLVILEKHAKSMPSDADSVHRLLGSPV